MNPEFAIHPENASTVASQVDALYFVSLAISAFFSVLIAACIFFFFVRYRRKPVGYGPQAGAPIHGSMALEILWSVVPLIICLGLFVWGSVVYYRLRVPPPEAIEYLVTGKQWMWKIQHPEGHREINTLHVPINQPIRLTMTSEDVIHSFYVPAFRVKQDVVPGRYTTVWFTATKTGTYHLFCTEYCGAEHSKMIGSVIVLERDEYQAWLAGSTPGATPVDSGEQLFAQYACNTCHMEDDGGRGPSLHDIIGEEVRIAGGRTMERTDTYLRESILHPSAKLVEGYQQLMPTFQGQISEEGVLHLIAYIKSLSDASATETAVPANNTAPSADPAATEAVSEGP